MQGVYKYYVKEFHPSTPIYLFVWHMRQWLPIILELKETMKFYPQQWIKQMYNFDKYVMSWSFGGICLIERS